MYWGNPNQILGYKYFTRLDMRFAYNLIPIKEGDEWKTAFRTQYGLYKFLVMLFGLTNTPATCQRFVKETLWEFLDMFCICYPYDILIYSETLENLQGLVRQVLTKLYDSRLHVKLEKCAFSTIKITFLGFVIN